MLKTNYLLDPIIVYKTVVEKITKEMSKSDKDFFYCCWTRQKLRVTTNAWGGKRPFLFTRLKKSQEWKEKGRWPKLKTEIKQIFGMCTGHEYILIRQDFILI